jgi:hypothetical protein
MPAAVVVFSTIGAKRSQPVCRATVARQEWCRSEWRGLTVFATVDGTRSVAAEATRRIDLGELAEIERDNGLQGLAGRGLAQRFR